MPDQTVLDAASADAPSGDPSSPDERIKKLLRQVSQKAEEARQASERSAALEKRIEELELARMPEAERETFLSGRERKETERLRTELELAKLALKYPDIAPHFNALFSAGTAEEQALYLKGLLNPSSVAADTAEDDDLSDVDMNNPMRGPKDPISLPPGQVNDMATADRVLAAFGNMPVRGR